MGMAHVALAVTVMLSLLAGIAPVLAIELGALQALPSRSPPYIFRLPVIAPPHGPAAIVAVTVRQPADALSFVQRNVVELRLRTLTDVELEVSQGGQSLNRLLLKSELQAARTRLDPMLASHAPQLTRAPDRDHPWAAALPPLPAAPEASQRTLLERELAGVRQEIHNLVARVTPWEGLAPPAGALGQRLRTVGLMLVLGGVCSAGIIALVRGYRMQRRARALTRSRPHLQDQRAGGPPTLPTVPPALRSPAAPAARPPVTMRRRVRVSQKTRRRFRVPAASDLPPAVPERTAAPVRRVARTSQRGPSAPAELLAALTQLRQELMRLQGRSHILPTPKPPEVR